eukprot:CAMPEP_0180709114 /NCGR_PEP_ID=MMETSP1038_2-20121128/9600_1 /TAXON_ID=632150 /ORGANISM="Azadinium spinosum, Strain 3D9" /LENGTH=212 /DNA_ID=CAMNT_0022741159 /DNA_START=71 /DNA_END=710 /DNA_ORIENTATION=-
MSDKADEVDGTGIPLKSSYDSMPLPIPLLYPTFNAVMMILSQVAAFFIGAHSSKYDSKIGLLASLGLGWIYIGSVILKAGQTIGIGVVLGQARKEAKVSVPDQHVYSVYTKPGAPKMGYVLMAKDGALGRFNRAQRSLQNYVESLPWLVAYYLLAGFVYPFPTFVLGLLYRLRDRLHGVGQRAMAGNMSGMLLLGIIEALVLVAGVKAILAE